MSKKLKWILGIAVLLVAALIVLGSTGVIGKEKGTEVATELVGTRTIIETVTASGKIYPEIEVKISPDVSGEITQLNVAEGDSVTRGQVLARIYADLLASQRDQAAAGVAQQRAQVGNSAAQIDGLQATVNQTEAAYKRQKQLLDDKVISRQEFELAEQAYLSAKSQLTAAQAAVRASQAGVSSAQSNLTRANKDLGRTTLIAPMSGIVSLLGVKKGERVAGNSFNVGTEMMRIADLSSIEAQVDVGENDIPKVKIGDSALIEVDAYNNRKFKGIVYKIANPSAMLQASGGAGTTVTNYKVHIRLLRSSYDDLVRPGQTFPFRPNMTASADIQTNTRRNVIAIPLNAVTTRDKDKNESKASTAKDKEQRGSNDDGGNNGGSEEDIQEVVFLLQKDGKVKKVPVTTGVQDINYIEITTGLKGGEEVIVGPYDTVSKNLKEGDLVKKKEKEGKDKKDK